MVTFTGAGRMKPEPVVEAIVSVVFISSLPIVALVLVCKLKEGRVVINTTHRNGILKRQDEEKLGRHTVEAQPGIGLEAEASVEFGLAQQDASVRAHVSEPLEPSVD